MIPQIDAYLNELNKGNPGAIYGQWRATQTWFAGVFPYIQPAEPYKVIVLPFYGQLTNMYLALLRDGALYGKDWGMSDSDQQSIVTLLTNTIQYATSYATNIYAEYRDALQKITKTDYTKIEPFRSVNRYDRQMTLMVLDFRHTWLYYDVTKHPTGAQVEFFREIYTDPMGTSYENNKEVLIPSRPTQRPTQIVAVSDKKVQRLMVHYPPNGGPGGVTDTDFMGSALGSNLQTIDIRSDNPIISAGVTWGGASYGDDLNTLQFTFDDGTQTEILGSGDPGKYVGVWGFYWESLSSIYINGPSYDIGIGLRTAKGANLVVFGFQYWKSPAKILRALRTLYVTSPRERLVTDYAQAYPHLGIPAESDHRRAEGQTQGLLGVDSSPRQKA